MKNLAVLPRELEGSDLFPDSTGSLAVAGERHATRSYRSPARDQQIRLEREVMHSLSGRHTPAIRRGLTNRLLVIVGIPVLGWAAAFGAISAFAG